MNSESGTRPVMCDTNTGCMMWSPDGEEKWCPKTSAVLGEQGHVFLPTDGRAQHQGKMMQQAMTAFNNREQATRTAATRGTSGMSFSNTSDDQKTEAPQSGHETVNTRFSGTSSKPCRSEKAKLANKEGILFRPRPPADPQVSDVLEREKGQNWGFFVTNGGNSSSGSEKDSELRSFYNNRNSVGGSRGSTRKGTTGKNSKQQGNKNGKPGYNKMMDKTSTRSSSSTGTLFLHRVLKMRVSTFRGGGLLRLVSLLLAVPPAPTTLGVKILNRNLGASTRSSSENKYNSHGPYEPGQQSWESSDGDAINSVPKVESAIWHDDEGHQVEATLTTSAARKESESEDLEPGWFTSIPSQIAGFGSGLAEQLGSFLQAGSDAVVNGLFPSSDSHPTDGGGSGGGASFLAEENSARNHAQSDPPRMSTVTSTTVTTLSPSTDELELPAPQDLETSDGDCEGEGRCAKKSETSQEDASSFAD
ncbi:unnamed protein product [Amoebophrya sp. A120]|nr:unnamed protein product [Amoebophrya sp. A120]|eukprot:GSA120T00019190001.1